MRWFIALALAASAWPQTLTGPASVMVGDPVFLRLAQGVAPVVGVPLRVVGPATEAGTVAAVALNFRATPDGTVRGLLFRGDRVLIVGQTGDGWCEVVPAYGGRGFVACAYLERVPYGQPLGTTDVDGRVVVTDLAIAPGVLAIAGGGATFNVEVRPAVYDVTATVAPGITHRSRRWVTENDGPVAMQVLEVDPREPNVLVLPVRARDRAVGRERTSAMAQRYGAMAGVNGGPFAGEGASTAGYQLEGQVVAATPVPRTALIRCADGTLVIDRQANCVVADLVGAGPGLVAEGRVEVGEDGFGNERMRMARTAFAITARGTWLLVTVDGRQASSAGMRADEFAAELVALGAVRAVNLDGGGSTTMVVGDTVRNVPSDAPSNGVEREVSDGVLVFSVETLERLRQVMDRVVLDPGQVEAAAIEPLYQHLDRAVAAFALEELEQVRLEVEGLRAEVMKRAGGELTRAAARVLGEALGAYLRLLPQIQQGLSKRRSAR